MAEGESQINNDRTIDTNGTKPQQVDALTNYNDPIRLQLTNHLKWKENKDRDPDPTTEEIRNLDAILPDSSLGAPQKHKNTLKPHGNAAGLVEAINDRLNELIPGISYSKGTFSFPLTDKGTTLQIGKMPKQPGVTPPPGVKWMVSLRHDF